MRGEIDLAAIDEISFAQINKCSIDLTTNQHLPDIRFGRNLIQVDPGWRLETGRAAMTLIERPFNVPFNLAWMNAEFVLQTPARPHGRCLLIFRQTDSSCRASRSVCSMPVTGRGQRYQYGESAEWQRK